MKTDEDAFEINMEALKKLIEDASGKLHIKDKILSFMKASIRRASLGGRYGYSSELFYQWVATRLFDDQKEPTEMLIDFALEKGYLVLRNDFFYVTQEGKAFLTGEIT